MHNKSLTLLHHQHGEGAYKEDDRNGATMLANNEYSLHGRVSRELSTNVRQTGSREKGDSHRKKLIFWTSLQSDQNLRGPHFARQQQLSTDICC